MQSESSGLRPRRPGSQNVRRDAGRHTRFNCHLVCAIGVAIGIAPIVAMGSGLDHRLPHWSSIPSLPFSRQLARGSQLLFAESGEAAGAFYFVYTDDRIQAFSPTRDKPLWTEPAKCRLLPRVLTLSKNRAVLANRYEISARDMRDGSRTWAYGQYPANLDDVRFDHENVPSFRYFTATSDRIFAVRDNGEISVIDNQTGVAIATHQLPHHPVNQPVICGDRLIFAARTPKGERLCIVKFAADKIEHLAHLNLGAAVTALTATEDSRIIAASIAGISAIDPTGKRVLWRWRSRQPLMSASLRVVGDGIYVATQDKIVVKLWLGGGTEAWRSQALAMHRDGATRLEIVDDHVVAIGDGCADVLFAATGKIIAAPWAGKMVTSDRCVLTSRCIVLLAQPDDGAEQGQSIRIYDHVDGKEVAEPEAMRSIKLRDEAATLIALNDALMIQDGWRILGWRVPPKPNRAAKSNR